MIDSGSQVLEGGVEMDDYYQLGDLTELFPEIPTNARKTSFARLTNFPPWSASSTLAASRGICRDTMHLQQVAMAQDRGLVRDAATCE